MFRPSESCYGPDGVPILSAQKIEAIGAELLEVHAPAVLTKPSPTPIINVIDKVAARTNLTYAMGDLGHRGGRKILGKVSFSTKTLLLDNSLLTERKQSFRFTAAHELGHWILHRYREIRTPNAAEPTIEFEDDENSVCRLDTRTPGDWLEWQANVFAAAVVMPQQTFKDAVIAAQQDLGITKNLGHVWLSEALYSQLDFNNLLSHLAPTYDVSRTSVEVRLRTLKLLTEEARRNTQPASNSLAGLLKGLNRKPQPGTQGRS